MHDNADYVKPLSVMPSPHVQEKAVRLLESGAVIVESTGRARVRGDSGAWYHVAAFDDGIFCSCPSRRALCAHACAAALAWAEVRGEAEAATAGLEPKASGMAAVAETAASPGRVPLATPDATRVHTPTHGDAA